MQSTKECSVCYETKPISDFKYYLNHHDKIRIHESSKCNECSLVVQGHIKSSLCRNCNKIVYGEDTFDTELSGLNPYCLTCLGLDQHNLPTQPNFDFVPTTFQRFRNLECRSCKKIINADTLVAAWKCSKCVKINPFMFIRVERVTKILIVNYVLDVIEVEETFEYNDWEAIAEIIDTLKYKPIDELVDLFAILRMQYK